MPINYVEWGILLTYILLARINVLYKKDKEYHVPRTGLGETGYKTFTSTAEFFEDKCNIVIKKKYPKSTHSNAAAMLSILPTR